MSKGTATTMATAVDSGYGLGWGISERGETGYFSHGGWDEGFCSQLTAHLTDGYGVVVMINSNHPAFMNEVVNAVAHTYEWDGYQAHELGQVLAAFKAALAAQPEEESLSEAYLNNMGFNALNDNTAYATRVMRINTDLYPDSANTWDSLAYAYQQAGNKEKAIEHYRNALKRDPEFPSALKGLAELDAEE